MKKKDKRSSEEEETMIEPEDRETSEERMQKLLHSTDVHAYNETGQ